MKAKPSLVWLHSHFLYSTGGTRFVYEIISELRHDFHVTVIVEKASAYWVKQYRSIGIDVVCISSYSSNSLLYWLALPYFLITLRTKLSSLLQKHDVIVSSMFPMHVVAGLLHTKSIYYCFEPFAFFYDRDLIRSFSWIKQILLRTLATIYSPIDRWGVSMAQKMFAINPSVGKHITSIYGISPDEYSYLGVDLTHFNMTIQPLRKKDTSVRLFHSTDYSTLKGTHYLIQSLSLLKNLPVILHISESVEDDIAKIKLKQMIEHLGLEQKVIFEGHLSYDDLPKMYRYCDIYCFVGSPESAGATAASLSVLEASACGIPVIRSIGNTDEVVDGKTGRLVDPRDSEALADVIKELVDDKDLRLKMGLAGNRHVKRLYTWTLVARRISTVISDLV